MVTSMPSNSPIPNGVGWGGEHQKGLSTSLFAQVKPICVNLSQIALLPSSVFRSDSEALLSAIKALNNTLQAHRRHNSPDNEYYSLLPNFADYVFFPLSNLLKQQALSDNVISNMLDIMSFLITNSWVPNGQFNDKLLDQLLPVILFLIKGANKDVDAVIAKKSLEFNTSTNGILLSVIRGSQGNYFMTQEVKRLSMLGDVASILLSMLKQLTNPSSPEEQQLVSSLLANMKLLFMNSISTEQLTRIIPGVTSTLINFVTQTKNLHFSIISTVIDLLRLTIVKVFNDEELSMEVKEIDGKSIDGFQAMWEANQNTQVDTLQVTANVSVSSSDEHITNSWLKATSNKLKISLNTLFKTIFLGHNKLKVSNKQQLIDSISLFVKDMLQFCFWSLFNELFALNIDILALVCSSRCFPASGPLEDQEQMKILNETILYLGPSLVEYLNSDIARKLLVYKLEDLIDNKTPLVMSSTDEDRTLQFITSLKFHFLLLEKHPNTKIDLVQLVEKQLVSLRGSLSDTFVIHDKLQTKTGDQLNQGETGDFDLNNKLDDIELPPYVRADNITKFRNNKRISKADVSSDLLLLSRLWSVSEWTGSLSLNLFEESFSASVENEIEKFVKFLSTLNIQASDKLVILENLLLNNQSSTQYMGLSLWLSNHFFGEMNRVVRETLKIDEFIDFGDDGPSDTETEDFSEEINYLVVSQSQELMESVAPHLNTLRTISTSKAEMAQNKIYEKSYSIALDSIGVLSNYLPKDEFKENFLMEFLFPIFEALTYNSNPRIQAHARNSVVMISKNHYNNSIMNLINENLDYLIDSLSLKLSVPGSITPALPGILIIILEVSGIELLLTNQLMDVISQIFVLIDSYHGYSILVEGFFIFFDKLVNQIKTEYLNSTNLKRIATYHSLYKPWGMTSLQQMQDLVSDSGKVFEPYEDYSRDKEYFTRKKDVPFAEIDSDDEDEAPPEEPEEKKVWESVVPKNIYFMVQRIFIYGLRLLSHPSDSLRVQILKTLLDVYPIMTTNYALVLPLVAQNWSSIISLLPNNTNLDFQTDAVSIKAIELLTLLLETDKYESDTFLSKRFIDLWTMINDKFKSSRGSSELMKVDSFKRSANVNLLKLLLKYLVTGLNTYERIIPDMTALKMMKFVWVIGVPHMELGKQARNTLWLVKYQHQ